MSFVSNLVIHFVVLFVTRFFPLSSSSSSSDALSFIHSLLSLSNTLFYLVTFPPSYYEQLTHILLEDVFFPSALEFLSALQFTSRQESESRDMMLWGSESLDEVLERDWDEEDALVDEEDKPKPLHVQVKGNMQVRTGSFDISILNDLVDEL